jgi:hypothetical protein
MAVSQDKRQKKNIEKINMVRKYILLQKEKSKHNLRIAK